MAWCRKCGNYIPKNTNTKHGIHRNKRDQWYCYNCAMEMGPDLIIDIGNFHAELYTSLMSPRAVSSYLAKCGKYAKEVTRQQKALEKGVKLKESRG